MRYLDRAINADATPQNWLVDNLAAATSFTAVVGYLDRAGFDLIRTHLAAMLDAGGEVRLVVDSREGLPRRADLASVLDFLSHYGDRASLRLATDVARLHGKVFLLGHPDGGRRALIGSANLTAAGLSRNWEACVAIERGSPADDQLLDQVERGATAWLASDATTPISRADLDLMTDIVKTEPTGVNEPIRNLIESAIDEMESFGAQGAINTGLCTGFADLDRLTQGLRPGQLWIVAGRPALGKSTLALDILRFNSIRIEVPTLLLTFEMTKEEITQRVLAAEARVPLDVLRSGLLSDKNWEDLAKRMGGCCDAPLHVNDSCQATLRHVAEAARRAVADDGVRLVAIDYVQLLAVDRRTENRAQEVAEISRGLKRLARELQVPIIAVCQLNRLAESRFDKRPQLGDLKDSGQLEQDADVVILLHRDDYYDRESPRAGEADFIVAKHRNGPTDTITVAAQLHFSRFMDMRI